MLAKMLYSLKYGCSSKLRREDGSMLAFEVKSAAAVTLADAQGLQAFAKVAGDGLQRSFVVYTGRAVIRLDDRIWALPVSSFF